MRFSRLLVITAALKQVLPSAFKIKTVLLRSSGGGFALVILNGIRVRASTTGSTEASPHVEQGQRVTVKEWWGQSVKD